MLVLEQYFCFCLFQEDQNRGKPNWEHLNDELHVLITVEDTENRAKIKLQRATEEIKKLLVPSVGVSLDLDGLTHLLLHNLMGDINILSNQPRVAPMDLNLLQSTQLQSSECVRQLLEIVVNQGEPELNFGSKNRGKY